MISPAAAPGVENLTWWQELVEPDLRKLGRTLFVVLSLGQAKGADRSTLAQALVASLQALGDVPAHQAMFIRRASHARLMAMVQEVAEKTAWQADAAMPLEKVREQVGKMMQRLTPTQRLELAKTQRPRPLVIT